MNSLPQAWKKWVLEQLLNGVPAMQTLNILLENGFTFEQSSRVLGSNLPQNLSSKRDKSYYENLANPGLLQQLIGNKADYLEQKKAQLVCIQDFLSQQECEQIVALSKTLLRPSTITTGNRDKGFRTSSTCDLPLLNNAQAEQVNHKIIQCLGLGVGEHEAIQAQHYAIGQQFKAHTDYFEPGSDEYKNYAGETGQRSWTFMLYLNETEAGGETEFLHLGLKFKPQTGMALVWNNLYPDGTPNPNTLHQAHPVISGEKVVITKWFRDR